jgi:hypothetical protein
MRIMVSAATDARPPRSKRLHSSTIKKDHCRDHRFQFRRLRLNNSGKEFDAYECSTCGAVVPAEDSELKKRFDRMLLELTLISKKLGE